MQFYGGTGRCFGARCSLVEEVTLRGLRIVAATFVLVAISSLGTALLSGCQKVSEPVVILTASQWGRVQEHV
ncbi:MAG: hypothetical protein KC561_21670, partial [Myxococcales bacterium]|nr:hypothetical protein [Myxococcales bacterium]